MNSLRTLPRSAGNWEVGEIAAPGGIDGVRSLVLVVEADTGLVRLVTAVATEESVEAHVRGAFERPATGTTPARPRALVVRDAMLLQELGPLLTEAGVPGVLARELPAVDEVTASLLNSLGGPPAPGITVDIGGWRQSLDTLVRLAPWTQIGDDVEFTFAGGGLDGALAVVLGNARQIRGIVLYPSRVDHARFVDHATSGEMPDGPAWVLHVEPANDLSAEERKACAGVGLALPDGDYPRLFGMQDAAFHSLDPSDQRRFRLALDAVNALCAANLGALAAGARASTTLRHANVSVNVNGETGEVLHALVQSDCAYSSGTTALTRAGVRREYTSLLLKLRKKEALALAAALSPITRITLRRGEIVAHDTDGILGCLVPAGAECESLVESFEQGDDVLLVLAAGGSTRPTVRAGDVVWSTVVRFEREDR